jgi:hypothetical protein
MFKWLKKRKPFQFFPIEQVGNWQLEMNRPFGFIVRNLCEPKTEFHFYFESNGYITSRSFRNPKEPEVKALTWMGECGANYPILVDRETCEIWQRMNDLRAKGKNLSESEAKELLVLSGQIK